LSNERSSESEGHHGGERPHVFEGHHKGGDPLMAAFRQTRTRNDVDPTGSFTQAKVLTL